MKITQEMITQVRDIDFLRFLQQVEGFTFKKVGQYYVCNEHNSLNLNYHNDTLNFYWNSKSQNGDIIQYVQHNILAGQNFISAVTYLINYVGTHTTTENKKVEGKAIVNTSNSLQLSISYNKYMKRAFAYLCKHRGISYQTIALFTKEGLIAQDHKGNIVFNHLNFSKKIVGAELKGTNTYKKFTGTAKGSNERYGFSYSIGLPKKIYVFEAEVDLLSFYDMYNHKLKDCLLLSTSGVNKYMKIATYLEKYCIGKIIFCMDNDKVANQTLKAVEEAFSHCKVVDGRKLLLQNNVKDFNELLLINR